MNNKWYVGSDSTKYYKVKDSLIVIKYYDSLPKTSIHIVENKYNLGNSPKVLFGWSYYTINYKNDSIFSLAESLLKERYIKNVIIPSYGEFTITPNDPFYNSGGQWYLSNNNNYPTINIESAWSLTTGNSNVRIAVIDAGNDWTHPDFGIGMDNYSNIFLNNSEDVWSDVNDPTTGNGLDDDNNGYVDDWKGYDFYDDDNNVKMSGTEDEHGLFVAGIIGAKTNNNYLLSGISGGWNNKGCEILMCRVGYSSPGNFVDPVALAEAIDYAINMQVHLINLSLSINETTNVTAAIESAISNGITVVCSSGNKEQGYLLYPANIPSVISVGACNLDDKRLYSTNYGENLDLSAPGKYMNLLSTFWSNQYITYSGTSFSTPIITGVVGLMKSLNPCLKTEQIRDILINTADKVGPYSYNAFYEEKPYHNEKLGYGKINPYEAVLKAQNTYSQNLDLYIKDRFNDLGDDASAYPVDNTPDIWVRNNPDGNEWHQNPSSTSGVDYVYLRIRNKSCVASSNGMSVSLYYTLASTTSVWPNDYILIGQQNIPVIAAGESKKVNIEWDHTGMPGGENVCLIAVIDGNWDPKTSYNPSLGLGHWITNDNNVAQKNLTITATSISNIWNGLDVPCGGTAYISNIYNEEFLYNIDFGYDEENRSLIFRQAEVNIFVNEDFWNIVNNSPDIEFNGVEVINENNLRLLNPEASINNLNMNPSEKFQIYIGYNFYSRYAEDTDELFYYSINQKESGEDGRFLGSMHFRILKESRDDFEADAGGDLTVESSTFNSVSAQDINETAVYNWYNSSDLLINNGKSFSYSPNKNSKLVLEVIADNDNFKDYDTINIKVKKHKILSINPNPSSSIIDIHYKAKNSTLSQIVIQRVDNSNLTYNYNINSGLSHKQINVSNYPIGIYNVFLVCDGDFSLAKKLIIQ